MVYRLLVTGFLAALLPAAPALAITAQEKMATCNFGADDQKLTGAKRKTFISKCMADRDEPAKSAKPAPKK
jgi:hypothetical protein